MTHICAIFRETVAQHRQTFCAESDDCGTLPGIAPTFPLPCHATARSCYFATSRLAALSQATSAPVNIMHSRAIFKMDVGLYIGTVSYGIDVLSAYGLRAILTLAHTSHGRDNLGLYEILVRLPNALQGVWSMAPMPLDLKVSRNLRRVAPQTGHAKSLRAAARLLRLPGSLAGFRNRPADQTQVSALPVPWLRLPAIYRKLCSSMPSLRYVWSV